MALRMWNEEDYIGLFNIQMAAGRNFSLDYSYIIDNQVIINETAAHMAGLTDPVGKKIKKWGQELEIIGVVKDFHFTSLKSTIQPLMFSYNPTLSKVFFIRVSDNNIGPTLQYIDTTFRRFDSNFTFDYSFVVRRKTKEMAVRKVMGLSVSSVMGVILKYFFIPITIATVFSLPVAYYFAHEWLKDFAYRINLSFWLLAFSVSIILLIAFLSMARQTIRAAIANPVMSLRLE